MTDTPMISNRFIKVSETEGGGGGRRLGGQGRGQRAGSLLRMVGGAAPDRTSNSGVPRARLRPRPKGVDASGA